jgi:hypothetical protein
LAKAAAKAREKEAKRREASAEEAKSAKETPRAEPAPSSFRARWRRPGRIAALAGAAVVALCAAMNGPALAAWLDGKPVHADDVWLPWKPARTPWQRAVVLRMEALDACAQSDWDACRRKLDEARILDPAGESSPSVQDARRRIESVEQQEELDADGGKPKRLKPTNGP